MTKNLPITFHECKFIKPSTLIPIEFYRLAPENSNRIEAVRYSLSMMSGPTIMAAFTTAATGILMSPSSVLAYRQIGWWNIIKLWFCTWPDYCIVLAFF